MDTTFAFSSPLALSLCEGIHTASLEAQTERICLQCRRPRFDPWVRKSPWRREWQPIPVFLPGESHRGARRAIVHRVAKGQTRLSD